MRPLEIVPSIHRFWQGKTCRVAKISALTFIMACCRPSFANRFMSSEDLTLALRATISGGSKYRTTARCRFGFKSCQRQTFLARGDSMPFGEPVSHFAFSSPAPMPEYNQLSSAWEFVKLYKIDHLTS